MSVLWGFINTGPFWKWQQGFDMSGALAKTGSRISHTNALSTTAYYAGVTLIAQTLAQVPLPLYETLDKGKRKAKAHPLYNILHDAPNPFMNAYDFKEAMQGNAVNWGNAFAEIEWEGDHVKALWPLRPDQMSIYWKEGELWYVYTLPSGEQVKVHHVNIFHLKGFSADGIIGYDPLTLAREAIGLAKATEEFGARFFSGGTQLSGVLTHPGTLSEAARDNMRESWNKMHQGLTASHRIAILEEGVTWQKTGVEPENAQFLETRKFQTSEIARFLHIPPHMIGDLEKATFSNIEHQGIEFVVYTMTPWFARWEQTITRKLLSLADKQKYFAEFLVTGLLRGDSESRARYYKERFYMGSMSPNDIREKENENPIPGGDDYYVPLNMMAIASTEEGAQAIKRMARIREAMRAKELSPAEWEEEYSEGIPHWALDNNPSVFAQDFASELKARKLSSILEIGCGNGRDSIFFSRAGFDVIGVDVSPSAIDLAKENAAGAGLEVDFRVANAEQLPFPDGQFNAVFSLSVLHSTDLKKSIPEIRRVVKGLAFIYLYGNTEFADGHQENIISVDDYLNLVKEQGFAILDFYSEQEEQFDEFGEKHLLIVSLLGVI